MLRGSHLLLRHRSTGASGQTKEVSQVALSRRCLGFCPKRQQIVELLNVGGNANNGAQCGVSYANSNNGFSNSNTNIGARLKLCTINTDNHCSQEHTIEPARWRVCQPDRANIKGVGYEIVSTESPRASKQCSCTHIPKAREPRSVEGFSQDQEIIIGLWQRMNLHTSVRPA